MEYIIRINDNDVVDSDGNKRIEEIHELVRCKDCKNVECEGVEGLLVCEMSGFSHSPEFFCADGERKEKEQC